MLTLLEIALILLPYIYFLVSKNMFDAIFSFGTKKGNKEAKYYAYTLPLLVIIMFYGGILNVHRYAVALIPIYWGLSKIAKGNKMARITITTLLSIMLAIGSMLFATWRWYL